MTGYQSKKAAALDEEGMYLVHHTKGRVFDKLGNKVKEDDDALTIAYQSGFFDGKKAAQRTEPVGCVADIDRLQRQMFLDLGYSLSDPLYTTPPAQPAQRTWVGLTKMELIKCGVFPWGMSYRLYEAIEAKLKEKNA